MKKKWPLLAILSISVFGLTACEAFKDMFYFGGSNYHPRSDVSTPPPGDTEAHKAPEAYCYGTYIKNNVYRLSSTPSTGTPRLLVIPVWFEDSNIYIQPAKKENVREDIQNVYFGTNEVTGWRSVSSYYQEESHGAVNLTGTVSEWYSCGDYVSNYGVDDGSLKTSDLVVSAVNWYFTGHPEESRKDYDYDGDGYLDGVMLIYAAPDNGNESFISNNPANKNKTNLWAYCFWIQDRNVTHKNVSNPGPNAFFWASYDFMYNSSKARDRAGNSYGSGDTKYTNLDAHTYIHEMGHMFGLEDYYDYSDSKYSPAAGFSMQDHNVGGHDPFSCYALGWGKAYVPVESTIINLKPFTSSGEMILLSPNASSYNYSPFDEYLLLEYYTPDGLNEFDTDHQYLRDARKVYPTGPVERGIRLWHVDARLAYMYAGNFSSSRMTTDPGYTQRVKLAMSNTYYASNVSESYLSPLADEDRSFCNYNLLQLIKKNGSGWKSKDNLTSAMLFRDNQEFSMSSSANQFVKSGKLNSGANLGFSFKVNALNSGYASIEVTKL